MSNDELKKKIMEIILTSVWTDNFNNFCSVDKKGAEHIADALIAAGIGDTEWQHDVFKKTYMDFIAKLHYDKKFFKRFDDVSLGCKLVMFEDMLDQNKKEFV